MQLVPSLLKDLLGEALYSKTKRGSSGAPRDGERRQKVPHGGAKLLARGPGILDGRWPRCRNFHSGKAGRGASGFRDSRSQYAGTSEKGELLIGDLHDVLPPPPMALACWYRGVRRVHWQASLPRQPYWDCNCIRFGRLHFAFPSSGFQSLGGLWFELRSTHVSLIALPALTATQHPFTRRPLQACQRRASSSRRFWSLHKTTGRRRQDLCGSSHSGCRIIRVLGLLARER
jgi:hypothetical protein